MKTGFLFFFFFFFFLLQTIYLLASCVQIPRAIRAFYHVWKWHNVQREGSEMRRYTTHALYRSKLWQQDHCQHPQNSNPDSSAGPQVQRDPGLASEGVLRLCTLLLLAPSSFVLNLLDYFVWSYVENITDMTSHNTKASLITAIRRTCGKSMLIVPDLRWLGLKAATLNRRQLCSIIKLPELIVSIKVLK